MVQIQFSDKVVSFETFVSAVARRVVSSIKMMRDDPEYVTQSKAFKMFGRANVERWRRTGKIEPKVRPGKLEYLTARLRELQDVEQDYFD